MMDYLTILAQTVEATQPAAEESVVPIDLFWEQVTSLGLLEALTFISFGIVCLLYGWRVFKILVVISFGLVGLALGITIGDKIQGQNSQILGGLIGLGLMAAVAVPLMRWAVSILGAIAGGLLTSGVWYAAGLTEKYIWAGALIGVIAGGMISFIVFKVAVMLFSSLGGSSLIVVGVFALLYLYPQTSQDIKDLVYDNKWFLPVALMVPTAVGIIVQNKFVKRSKEWSV
ncbi:MAG TPA: hypothetical protein VMX13_03800 [Sedimentisphaerales bacterium]|nr:hypothetical protein [Sedimentisphaerales bacterium]